MLIVTSIRLHSFPSFQAYRKTAKGKLYAIDGVQSPVTDRACSGCCGFSQMQGEEWDRKFFGPEAFWILRTESHKDISWVFSVDIRR